MARTTVKTSREVRIECQTKQAPLIETLLKGHRAVAEIEERRLQALAVSVDDVDLARLLTDEAAPVGSPGSATRP